MYIRQNHSLPKSQNGPEKKVFRSGQTVQGLWSLVSLITGEKMSQIRQELRPWEQFQISTFGQNHKFPSTLVRLWVKSQVSFHSCQAFVKITSFLPLLSGFWLRLILSELFSVRACVFRTSMRLLVLGLGIIWSLFRPTYFSSKIRLTSCAGGFRPKSQSCPTGQKLSWLCRTVYTRHNGEKMSAIR